MDSWTLNKIIGAVLGTSLMVFLLQILGGAIFHPEAASTDKPGFAIAVAESEAPAAGGEAAAPAVSIGTLLAKADATAGATEAKSCAACHDFAKGGPNKTGPNLWDVVERPVASHEGFAYSEGMKSHTGTNWTYDELNAFIKSPKEHVKGTKMAFGGIKNDAKRASLIAYLATLSDSPKPFPAP